MKRVPKRFAYGEITDTNKKFKEEHDSLIQKWKDDLNLKLGDIPQPNQSKDSIECGCGSHYTKDNRHHHIKTKKHLEFISAAKTDIETSIFH
jgi:hypothetical protein